MTEEERLIRKREAQLRFYHRNKEKINAARKKIKMEIKCPCSRPAIKKLTGIPICSFCLEIENKLGRFELI